MNITPYEFGWNVENEGSVYAIMGNPEDGYDIYEENVYAENEEEHTEISPVYSNVDFESCLMWCFNS